MAGGTGALGRAVCRSLLEAGFEVHATTTSPPPTADAVPQGLEAVRFHRSDLARPQEAERAFDDIGGPLAAVVSTVGGFAGGPLAEVDAAGLDRLVDLNFRTAVWVLRAAFPHLERSPRGSSVVLVGARGAVEGGPGAAVYSATKAAVVNLAVSAAREWLEEGISVNAVLPSTMDTPANRRAMPDADASRWPGTDEVAAVIRFLAGPEARIVSGAAIPVYGRAR